MAMTSEQFQQMMSLMTLQQQAIKAKDEQISKLEKMMSQMLITTKKPKKARKSPKAPKQKKPNGPTKASIAKAQKVAILKNELATLKGVKVSEIQTEKVTEMRKEIRQINTLIKKANALRVKADKAKKKIEKSVTPGKRELKKIALAKEYGKLAGKPVTWNVNRFVANKTTSQIRALIKNAKKMSA